MKFMITHDIAPEHFIKVTERFMTGKEKIPKGMKLVGRWHTACHGWTLVEADDPVAVYRFTDQWEDLVRFQVMPVMDDAETASVVTAR